MGCISSKIITRSRSYQEELNQSFRRKDNGLPVLEELFVSKNGNDHRQFLTLIRCTSSSKKNTAEKKHQSGFHPNSESSFEDVVRPSLVSSSSAEIINSWELMDGLDEQDIQLVSSPRENQELDYQLTRRKSKSFHWVVEHDLSSSTEDSFFEQKDHRSNTTGKNNSNMGVSRSRSYHFHTLQEYEEMVERKRRIQAREVDINSDISVISMSITSCDTTSDMRIDSVQKVDNVGIIEEKDDKYRLLAEVEISKDNEENPRYTTLESVNRSINAEIETIDDEFRAQSSKEYMNENGSKRKTKGKELASLSVSSSSSPTIEFPKIGSLKQWVDDKVGEEQVNNSYYSSEAYVTPKFGSFSVPIVPRERKRYGTSSSGDHSVFESEMVADFEKAMQQLQVDEESVLRQIEEDSLEEDGIIDTSSSR